MRYCLTLSIHKLQSHSIDWHQTKTNAPIRTRVKSDEPCQVQQKAGKLPKGRMKWEVFEPIMAKTLFSRPIRFKGIYVFPRLPRAARFRELTV